MKILSLFDGMACGHIAFNEFGRFQKILKIFLNPLTNHDRCAIIYIPS